MSLSALIGLINSVLIIGMLDRWGVLTRAPAKTSSGYCNGGMESFEEVAKSFLFLFQNGLVDPLGLELLEL